MIDIHSSINFAHGRHDEGSKCEAENVNGYDECGYHGRVVVELGHDAGDSWRKHGRALQVSSVGARQLILLMLPYQGP